MDKAWRQPRLMPIFLIMLAFWQAPLCLADLKTHQIKAAYLYQISKFVFWPDASKQRETFSVCQFGKDAYDGTLEKMTGRTVFNKPVTVSTVNTLSQATNCHLLILSTPEKINVNELRNWLKTNNVLTVVDGEQYQSLGMVAFVLENQRIRLHINLDLTKRTHLSFAANLLEVASYIHRGDE